MNMNKRLCGNLPVWLSPSAMVLLMLCPVLSTDAAGQELRFALAELQGADREAVPVTQCLYTWFSEVGERDGAFSVESLGAEFHPDSSAGGVIEELILEDVDLIVYGSWDVPSISVSLVISAVALSDTGMAQPVHLRFDGEGSLPLSGFIPGSDPPAMIEFSADVLTAVVLLQRGSLEEAEAHLASAGELADEVQPETAAAVQGLRGFLALQAGDPGTAASMARIALELDPEATMSLSVLAEAHEMLGEVEDALEAYRELRELDPANAFCMHNMGRMYQQLGHLDSALVWMEEALELAQDDPVILNSKGYVHNALQEYESAMEDISRALEIDPEYGIGWANLACAQRAMGDLDQAIESFTNAVSFEDDPVNVASYLRDRAHCHYALEEYGSSASDCGQSLSLVESDPRTHALLAMARMGLEDYYGALQDIDAALELAPGDPDYLSLRGRCRYMTGDLEFAIADYTQAFSIDAEGFEDCEYLGKAYAESGDFRSAIEWFSLGADRSEEPDERAWLHSYMGLCHFESGDLESALASYAEAVDIYPEEPYFHFMLGEKYWLLDREVDAVPCYDDAIELDLRDSYMPGCLYQRGRSHLVLGDYPQAIDDLTGAIDRYPGNADAYYFRGRGHLVMESYDEAVDDFSEALALDPEDTIPLFWRGIAHSYRGDVESCRVDLERYLRNGSNELLLVQAASILDELESQ